MRRYLVLIPPGGPEKDHQSTLFLRDGFSWLALLFPTIWLLAHRLWAGAAVAFTAQCLPGILMALPGFEPAALLTGLAIHLLAGLESQHYRSEVLLQRGWSLVAIIPATDLDSAEDMYFSNLPSPDRQPLASSDSWASGTRAASGWDESRFGLFDYQGGR